VTGARKSHEYRVDSTRDWHGGHTSVSSAGLFDALPLCGAGALAVRFRQTSDACAGTQRVLPGPAGAPPALPSLRSPPLARKGGQQERSRRGGRGGRGRGQGRRRWGALAPQAEGGGVCEPKRPRGAAQAQGIDSTAVPLAPEGAVGVPQSAAGDAEGGPGGVRAARSWQRAYQAHPRESWGRQGGRGSRGYACRGPREPVVAGGCLQ